MLDLICFDCDGVLVDSEYLSACVTVDLFEENGISISVRQAIELLTGKSQAATHALLTREYGSHLADQYQLEHEPRLLSRFHTDLKAIPGVATLLAGLSTPCCVTSNSPQNWIRAALTKTRLIHYFGNNIFGMENVKEGKPAPDIFFLATETFTVQPGNCLVIDDSVTGILAAKAAGATAIGFCGGSHIQENHESALFAAGADEVCRDMAAFAATLAHFNLH